MPAATGGMAPKPFRRAGIALAGILLWLLIPGEVFARLSVDTAPSAPDSGYSTGPAGAWVVPAAPFATPSAARETRAGSETPDRSYRYRLNDIQIDARTPGDSAHYVAIEYQLNNRYAVENYSQLQLDFDPHYETLTLHEIRVQRGDSIVDKLAGATIRRIQREPSLESLIYDGTETLSVLLRDIRVGDTIRYAYTIRGENPIFAGLRETRWRLDARSPVDRLSRRLVTRADTPLVMRTTDAVSERPAVTTKGDTVVHSLLLEHVPARRQEDGLPPGQGIGAIVSFSDIGGWQDVVNWALPMYSVDDVPADEIDALARGFVRQYPDPQSRIGAALHWVQQEVRYFGVELGVNSHLPSRPAVTLARRYGDCKDKTLLLLALLEAMGIEAWPALVNTGDVLAADDYPLRLHAFDHVIAYVEVDGKGHFIDPTDTNQRGALGEFSEPDYGKALLVRPGTHTLTPMSAQTEQLTKRIEKRLVVDFAADIVADAANPMSHSMAPAADDALFEVRTRADGFAAERLRYSRESDGLDTLDTQYESYYQGVFETASVARDQTLTFDDRDDNTVEMLERYRLGDWWSSDENIERYAWLYGDEVVDYLETPEPEEDRQGDYYLGRPRDIVEHWTLELPYRMRLEDLYGSESNAWFDVSKTATVTDEGRRVEVTMQLRSRQRQVPPERIQDYLAAVARAKDLLSFYVEDEGNPGREALGTLARLGTLIGGAETSGAAGAVSRADAVPEADATRAVVQHAAGSLRPALAVQTLPSRVRPPPVLHIDDSGVRRVFAVISHGTALLLGLGLGVLLTRRTSARAQRLAATSADSAPAG